ncbi:MAG: hypothetical protein ACLUE5_02305 [Dysosmobacter sp.]
MAGNRATYVDVFYDYNALAKGVYDTILITRRTARPSRAVMINPSVWTKENASEFGNNLSAADGQSVRRFRKEEYKWHC